ncbi:MAG TPA: hypothetical protein VL361_26260 [Candidatus Limnocylindrales bacterium]|jgi:hypothetical protein|nr:hypothetical protein [Candidatus Limnocylindrales bacterium]
MSSTLVQILRGRPFAVGVHVSLWLLLGLVMFKVGGKAPDFRDSDSFSAPPQNLAPVTTLGSLFASVQWPTSASGEGPSPFFTRYFVPVPSPEPPPPTTRKIEVTYQGYFQAEGSPKTAILKVGDTFVAAAVGSALETNYFVADATMQTLTLTNQAAQTTLLPLNSKKEIEVPIK